MTLSDKEIDIASKYDDWSESTMFQKKDVKQFIKDLKAKSMLAWGRGSKDPRTILRIIDELAGKELI